MPQPAQVRIMQSAAFKAAYLELAPKFEAASGHTLDSLWVPSAQIVGRLGSGERVDLVIASAATLDDAVQAGYVASKRCFEVARCGVAAAVRTGAPKPDISSAEALMRAVLAAQSVVYSRGPSGVYLEALFRRLGIAEAIAQKVKRVQGEPAGGAVARGEAELGFQQMSELLPVEGIDIIGPLPAEVQEITTFSAGLHVDSQVPDAALGLVRFFKSAEAASVIRASGMEPVSD